MLDARIAELGPAAGSPAAGGTGDAAPLQGLVAV